MARFTEPAPEQEAAWSEWLSERPRDVQAVAARFEPWSLYKMLSTGHRVTLVSVNEAHGEPVTLTVAITGQFNALLHDRAVFGIDPDDLVPCDLPDPSEKLGAQMTREQVEDNIDAMRVLVRPDLWELDQHGIAVRKAVPPPAPEPKLTIPRRQRLARLRATLKADGIKSSAQFMQVMRHAFGKGGLDIAAFRVAAGVEPEALNGWIDGMTSPPRELWPVLAEWVLTDLARLLDPA